MAKTVKTQMVNKLSKLMAVLVLLLTINTHAEENSTQTDDSANSSKGNTQEEQSLELFKKATDYYSQEKYEEASDTFREAYNLRPSWKLLFNMGQADAAAKRHGLALESFEKYLAMGGDEVTDSRKNEVYKNIDELRKIVGSIDIEGSAGLDVYVDNINRGTLPLSGSIRATASIEHTIELKNGENVVYTKKITVAGDEKITITADELSTPKKTAAKPAKTKTPLTKEQKIHKIEKRKKLFKIFGWVSMGTGALSLSLSPVAFAKAKKMSDDIDNCLLGTCLTTLPQDKIDRDNMQSTAYGLLGIGIVGIAAGTTLFILAHKQTKRLNALSSHAFITPLFSKDQASLFLTASF
ncbi:MAG: tetratricopeptide repeat protein [Deltaproteobacteria bacterium]|nr:tetratricopeptide repeat protein [Deltaproteobacteria bacterium]